MTFELYIFNHIVNILDSVKEAISTDCSFDVHEAQTEARAGHEFLSQWECTHIQRLAFFRWVEEIEEGHEFRMIWYAWVSNPEWGKESEQPMDHCNVVFADWGG